MNPSFSIQITAEEVDALRQFDHLLSAPTPEPNRLKSLAELDPIVGSIFSRAFEASRQAVVDLVAEVGAKSPPLPVETFETLLNLRMKISGQEHEELLALSVDGPRFWSLADKVYHVDPLVGPLLARALGAAIGDVLTTPPAKKGGAA